MGKKDVLFSTHQVQESRNGRGSIIHDIILGGQDGVVNVLGIVLGVATATNDARIVLISGLAATFAESISMGAVAYTSSKAALDFYKSELAREEEEIMTVPNLERQEIRDIYAMKGFSGKLLDAIVKKITSSKKLWLDTMMAEEIKIFPNDYLHPLKNGLVVFFASLIGSFIPLLPFFVASVDASRYISLGICTLTLFITGSIKAKLTIGKWWKSGIEMALIGAVAALAGYGIGVFLGATYL